MCFWLLRSWCLSSRFFRDAESFSDRQTFLVIVQTPRCPNKTTAVIRARFAVVVPAVTNHSIVNTGNVVLKRSTRRRITGMATSTLPATTQRRIPNTLFRDSASCLVNTAVVTKLCPCLPTAFMLRDLYRHRRNATRSAFSAAFSFNSMIRLKNSTVSSSVSRRPSCK